MKLISFKDKKVDQEVIPGGSVENLGYNNLYLSKSKDFFIRINANSEDEISCLKICIFWLTPIFCSRRL
ncbi:MAG: hypothetical protein ACFFDF_20205, partial [Candidatus Odinarchaeota archaeon]